MISHKTQSVLIVSAIGLSTGLTVNLSIAATRYRDGNYRGRTFSAYYGEVQVEAQIRHGQLYYVDILKSPSDRRTSRIIARRSLPRLESEVVQAQSAQVDTVSGATLTSRAFLRSLDSALHKARRP